MTRYSRTISPPAVLVGQEPAASRDTSTSERFRQGHPLAHLLSDMVQLGLETALFWSTLTVRAAVAHARRFSRDSSHIGTMWRKKGPHISKLARRRCINNW